MNLAAKQARLGVWCTLKTCASLSRKGWKSMRAKVGYVINQTWNWLQTSFSSLWHLPRNRWFCKEHSWNRFSHIHQEFFGWKNDSNNKETEIEKLWGKIVELKPWWQGRCVFCSLWERNSSINVDVQTSSYWIWSYPPPKSVCFSMSLEAKLQRWTSYK